MENLKTRLKLLLWRKTGATDVMNDLRSQIGDLRRQLGRCRVKASIDSIRHEQATRALNDRIAELQKQDGLARMLDTQRNRTQQQEIADLRAANKSLRRKLDGLL